MSMRSLNQNYLELLIHTSIFSCKENEFLKILCYSKIFISCIWETNKILNHNINYSLLHKFRQNTLHNYYLTTIQHFCYTMLLHEVSYFTLPANLISSKALRALFNSSFIVNKSFTLAYFLGSFRTKNTISSTCTRPVLPISMALQNSMRTKKL